MNFNFETRGSGLNLLEICSIVLKDKLEQEQNKHVYNWTIDLQEGQIKLKSYGFEQIARHHPILLKSQILTLEQRGGISFDRK